MTILQKDKPAIETLKTFLENPELFLLEGKTIGPGHWNKDVKSNDVAGHLTQ
ncbi:MAG: hypothetical protein ACT4OY_01315 [Alphaproteobacteria bacterium]